MFVLKESQSLISIIKLNIMGNEVSVRMDGDKEPPRKRTFCDYLTVALMGGLACLFLSYANLDSTCWARPFGETIATTSKTSDD